MGLLAYLAGHGAWLPAFSRSTVALLPGWRGAVILFQSQMVTICIWVVRSTRMCPRLSESLRRLSGRRHISGESAAVLGTN